MNVFVARASPWRLILLLFLAGIFFVMALWMAGFFGLPLTTRSGTSLVGMGWLLMIIMGGAAIKIFFNIFDSDDQVRISSLGIYSKQWSDCTIPWSEIIDTSVWQYKGQKTILLHLRDAKRFPSTTIFGKLGAANRALTGGDISITLLGTDKSFKEAVAAIEYYSDGRNALSAIEPTVLRPVIQGFGKKGM